MQKNNKNVAFILKTIQMYANLNHFKNATKINSDIIEKNPSKEKTKRCMKVNKHETNKAR